MTIDDPQKMISTDPANPVLKMLENEDNARTGARTIVQWEGTEAQCEQRKMWAISLGASSANVRSVGNGWWVCDADFPFGFDGLVTDYGTVPSIHELQTVVAQISVYRSSKLRALLLPNQIGVVAQIVADFQNALYSKSTADRAAQISAAETDVGTQLNGTGAVAGRTEAQAKADGLSLFRAVAYLGVEDVIEYRQVYQRTLTAATPQQVTASFEGVGKIWTTAEVMAFEGLNPNGFFQLDGGMQWLKSKPVVTLATGSKTQIVYTYTECLVALGLTYDAYKGAKLLFPPA